MIEWDEWNDVKKDGTLMQRKIHSSDDKYDKPHEFAKCKISYLGKVLDNGFVFAQKENEEIVLNDDENFPPGFHNALSEMCVGEQSEFKISPSLAFGTKGNPQIQVPPNAVVSYVITLHSAQNPREMWDMSTEEHFSETEAIKATANEIFRKGEYSRAIKHYERALKIIKHDSDFKDEEKQKAKPLVLTLNSNLALVYFKLQQYTECLEKSNEVLTEDKNNLKALVRRGHAHMMLGNNDLAKVDFKQALELDPKNADVKKLMEANKKHIQQQNEKERKLYANMFAQKSTGKKKKVKSTTTSSDTTQSKQKEETLPTESSEK